MTGSLPDREITGWSAYLLTMEFDSTFANKRFKFFVVLFVNIQEHARFLNIKTEVTRFYLFIVKVNSCSHERLEDVVDLLLNCAKVRVE